MKKVVVFIIIFLFLGGNASDRIHLTLFHGFIDPTLITGLEKIVSDFNRENPDITVTPVYYGTEDQLVHKINLWSQSQNSPDMLVWNPQFLVNFFCQDYLADLTDFWNLYLDKKVLPDFVRENHQWKNKYFAIPITINCLGLYVNTQLLPKGTNLDSLSIENFIQLCNDIAAKGIHPIYIPYHNQEWTVWLWELFYWNLGGELKLEADSNFTDSLALVKSFEFYKQIYDCTISSSLNHNVNQSNFYQHFLRGKSAMMIMGNWVLNDILQHFDLNDLSVIPIPSKSGEINPITNIGGESISVLNKNKKQKEACYQFLSYLVQSPQLSRLNEFSGNFNPLSVAYLKPSENSLKNSFIQLIQKGKIRPSHPLYKNFSAYTGTFLNKYLMQQAQIDMIYKNLEIYLTHEKKKMNMICQ